MRQDNRQIREQQITAAAYEVLEEKGYAGTSMLAIARRARASNETLYNWYGDKSGLFKTLVINNAAFIRAELEQHLTHPHDPIATLRRIGPILLDLLLGDRAIALNRAAAADPTGELGTLISRNGREVIAPMIGQLLEHARDDGLMDFQDTDKALDLYLRLLVGDQQIRRVIGQASKPKQNEMTLRSDEAVAYLLELLGGTTGG